MYARSLARHGLPTPSCHRSASRSWVIHAAKTSIIRPRSLSASALPATSGQGSSVTGGYVLRATALIVFGYGIKEYLDRRQAQGSFTEQQKVIEQLQEQVARLEAGQASLPGSIQRPTTTTDYRVEDPPLTVASLSRLLYPFVGPDGNYLALTDDELSKIAPLVAAAREEAEGVEKAKAQEYVERVAAENSNQAERASDDVGEAIAIYKAIKVDGGASLATADVFGSESVRRILYHILAMDETVSALGQRMAKPPRLEDIGTVLSKLDSRVLNLVADNVVHVRFHERNLVREAMRIFNGLLAHRGHGGDNPEEGMVEDLRVMMALVEDFRKWRKQTYSVLSDTAWDREADRLAEALFASTEAEMAAFSSVPSGNP